MSLGVEGWDVGSRLEYMVRSRLRRQGTSRKQARRDISDDGINQQNEFGKSR